MLCYGHFTMQHPKLTFNSIVFAYLDNIVDVQISSNWGLVLVEEEGLIGLVAMLGESVCTQGEALKQQFKDAG